MMQWAKQLVVANKEDAEAALAQLSNIKAARRKWTDYWGPLKKAAHDSWKGIVAKEKEGTDIIDAAERTVKGKVVTWQRAEQEKAEAERRRLQAIADEQARKERERLEKEAARLKTPEKKEERLEQAAAVAAPVIEVAAPSLEVKGVAGRVTWKAELVSMEELIRAASPGSVAASLLSFNQKAGDAFARATKGQTAVPGIRFREEHGLAVKAAQ